MKPCQNGFAMKYLIKIYLGRAAKLQGTTKPKMSPLLEKKREKAQGPLMATLLLLSKNHVSGLGHEKYMAWSVFSENVCPGFLLVLSLYI